MHKALRTEGEDRASLVVQQRLREWVNRGINRNSDDDFILKNEQELTRWRR